MENFEMGEDLDNILSETELPELDIPSSSTRIEMEEAREAAMPDDDEDFTVWFNQRRPPKKTWVLLHAS